MTKLWKVRPYDRDLVRQISVAHKVGPVVAQILASREITNPQQLDSFFDTRMSSMRPPRLLPGVDQAVEIIHAAIGGGKKIVVYGDYDCDGMTATAILCRCLQQLGGEVSYFVPNRLDDGYGLNSDQIRRLKQNGANLIVTVDCGIASVAEAKVAAEIGVELIITDHHTPGPVLPTAAAIVHPALPGEKYPFPGLCGAGVAFKLVWALCQHHCKSDKLPAPFRELLFQSIGLAAIGTVADVVPLVDENRILVFHGLKLLRTHASVGLKFLMQRCKLDGKAALTAEDIGFGIGPRLNASGRLGQAQLGVELLLCEQENRADQLAEYIDNLNKSRDSLERNIIRDVHKLLQDEFDPQVEPALVLADPHWHQGVIGIVAGRLAEKYNRPTVIIRNDSLSGQPAVGSARSACGLNLYEALHACRQHLVGFGGHAAAAGLQISCESIAAFREDFCEHVRQTIAPSQQIPVLLIDAEVALCELSADTVKDIEALAPFGHGNARPLLCVNNATLSQEPQKIGTDARHLSLNIEQDQIRLRCVAFGHADWAERLQVQDRYDFVFKPVINAFRGMNRVELQLIDFRPARTQVAVV